MDLKEGCLPAWSLRALGSIEQTKTRRGAEVRNLRLITWDNVIYPSHHNVYTRGLVSESVAIDEGKKINLQAVYESNDISETNDINCRIITPVTNSDVINFLQLESSNLKFIR